MLRFEKETYLSLLFKFIYVQDLVIVCENQMFINLMKTTVYILFYNFIKFIMLLHTFLVISFAQYKEYIICLILFSKFPNVLPAFTSARTVANLWSICFLT